MITIFLNGKFIVTGEVQQIEVFDVVCNRSAGVFALEGNARIPVQICDKDGFGEVRWRNVTNNGPFIGSPWLHDQDDVSP
jgi:hypothetical protein